MKRNLKNTKKPHRWLNGSHRDVEPEFAQTEDYQTDIGACRLMCLNGTYDYKHTISSLKGTHM